MIMATRIQHCLIVDETDIITSSATSPKNYIIATSRNQYGQIVGLSGCYSFRTDMYSSQTSPIQDIGILNKNKGD